MDDFITLTKSAHITVYHGKDGLLQVTKHSLTAESELLIYEASFASLNEFLDKEQADEIRKEFVRKGIKVREITNHAYQEGYTDVSGYDEKVMNIRYINPKKLQIDTEMLIYNDIITIYSLTEPLYIFEIQDANLAKMQKQIFEFAWKTADRAILGRNGRSSIF